MNVSKTVDGVEPTVKQKYDFVLKKLRNKLTTSQYNEGDYWEELRTAQNTLGTVTFDDVSFYSSGKYYFLIYEDTSDPEVNDVLDDTMYLVECEVDKTGNTLHMIEDSFKHYKIIDFENLVVVSENQGIKQTSINEAAIEELEGTPSWTEGEDEEAGKISSSIQFKNKKIKSGLNIRKEVTGSPATDPEFTFMVYLWTETENDDETEYDYIDLTENNIDVKKTASDGTENTVDLQFATQGTFEGHKASVETFTLKKNETLSITGVLVGTHYAVLEKVNDDNVPQDTDGNEIAGYKLVAFGSNTENPEDGVSGVISQGANSSVVIICENEFTEAKGEITLTKTGKDNAKLAGAKFDLYRVKTGDETADVKINNADLVTNSDGQISADRRRCEDRNKDRGSGPGNAGASDCEHDE